MSTFLDIVRAQTLSAIVSRSVVADSFVQPAACSISRGAGQASQRVSLSIGGLARQGRVERHEVSAVCAEGG
jgi:hypothetical protein